MNGIRRRVIATTGFVSQETVERAGKHPAVNDLGGIRRDIWLWSDDPIVIANPHLFVDESVIPGPPVATVPHDAETPETARPSGPEWKHLVRGHRATGKPRPKMLEVAKKMGWDTEEPLRQLCRRLRIKDWRDVHALVAAEPE